MHAHPAHHHRPVSPVLHALMAAIGIAAVALPSLVVATTPRVVPAPPSEAIAAVTAPKRVVPRAEVPEVEPVALAAVDPNDARAINAAIPLSALPNPAASAFRLTGSPADQARAVDCLAAAVYYEAGDDAEGQKAVAQVVLNRVRHPAFPGTVCGVVFQGSERRTGCQFTFICDGAMARTPSPAAWGRAREIARAALTGTVYKPVGHATHYHTDWVVPYWSASLEKITEVHTHLFFRWTGWWGTPRAFNRAYAGAEPTIPLLARLAPEHGADGMAAAEDGPAAADAALPKPIAAQGDSFLVTLDPRMAPDEFAALAIRTCGERPRCKFMGWTEAGATPTALPLDSRQVSSMAFSYLRDERQGFAKALWNCDKYRRPSPLQCMRPQPLATARTPPAAPAPTPVVADEGPSALKGVRRASPAPRPTPSAAAPVASPAPAATPGAAD
jgi:spore germination cell wall hydrolase CwlJ-like protein